MGGGQRYIDDQTPEVFFVDCYGGTADGGADDEGGLPLPESVPMALDVEVQDLLEQELELNGQVGR